MGRSRHPGRLRIPWEEEPPHHVGHYTDAYNVGEVIITREGDTLHIEAPLLTQYGYEVGPELHTVSSDTFYLSLDGAWYDLCFIPEAEGEDSRWIRNRAFVLTRDPAPPSPPAATLPRERVERWLLEARLRDHPAPAALLGR